jgi:hypothetical protein
VGRKYRLFTGPPVDYYWSAGGDAVIAGQAMSLPGPSQGFTVVVPPRIVSLAHEGGVLGIAYDREWTAAGIIELSSPAVPGGSDVGVMCSSPLSTVPNGVTISEGSTNASFPITVRRMCDQGPQLLRGCTQDVVKLMAQVVPGGAGIG